MTKHIAAAAKTYPRFAVGRSFYDTESEAIDVATEIASDEDTQVMIYVVRSPRHNKQSFRSVGERKGNFTTSRTVTDFFRINGTWNWTYSDARGHTTRMRSSPEGVGCWELVDQSEWVQVIDEKSFNLVGKYHEQARTYALRAMVRLKSRPVAHG